LPRAKGDCAHLSNQADSQTLTGRVLKADANIERAGHEAKLEVAVGDKGYCCPAVQLKRCVINEVPRENR
jgi:hypothetical protein